MGKRGCTLWKMFENNYGWNIQHAKKWENSRTFYEYFPIFSIPMLKYSESDRKSGSLMETAGHFMGNSFEIGVVGMTTSEPWRQSGAGVQP